MLKIAHGKTFPSSLSPVMYILHRNKQWMPSIDILHHAQMLYSFNSFVTNYITLGYQFSEICFRIRVLNYTGKITFMLHWNGKARENIKCSQDQRQNLFHTVNLNWFYCSMLDNFLVANIKRNR